MVLSALAVGAVVLMARTGGPVASAASPAPYPLVKVTGTLDELATDVSDDGDVVMIGGTAPRVLHRGANRSVPIAPVVGGWPSLTGDGTAAYRIGDAGIERLDTSSGVVTPIDLHLPGGVEPGSVAADAHGRWLAVTAESPTTLRSTVFLADTATGTLVDARAGFTDPWPQVHEASISGDGRFVAYTHTDTQSDWGLSQVYLFDRVTGTTTLMQPWPGRPTGEVGAPQMSADGRFVTYLADASKRPAAATTNVDAAKPAFSFPIPNYAVALYDVAAGTTQIVGTTTDPIVAFVGDGGRRVVFSNRAAPDANRQRFREVDLWEDGVVMPLVRQPDGTAIVETNLHAIDADGSLVLFDTNAPTLATPYVTSFLAQLPALPVLPPTTTTTTTRPVTTTTQPPGATTTTTVSLPGATTTTTTTTMPAGTPSPPRSGVPSVIVHAADVAEHARRLPAAATG